MWGATGGVRGHPRRQLISIRAPRVGSDFTRLVHALYHRAISIRAPRVGSDSDSDSICLARCYFNPRSPCGERPLHFVAHGQYNLLIVLSKFKLRKIAYM